MGYAKRLELTLVSSINELWLVKLIYVEDVIPLTWSVFTLVCFTRLIYIYIYKKNVQPKKKE